MSVHGIPIICPRFYGVAGWIESVAVAKFDGLIQRSGRLDVASTLTENSGSSEKPIDERAAAVIREQRG